MPQSHACVTHTVQDSSVSHEGGRPGRERGGGEGRVVGRLPLRRRSPGTPSPSAAIYRPRSTRFAPGPSCLLQLGSHQPRDNKQVHRTGPCAHAGAAASETPAKLTAWPPPRRPGRKTRLFSEFFGFGCFFFKSRRAAGTRHRLRTTLFLPSRPLKDVGDRESQIMKIVRRIRRTNREKAPANTRSDEMAKRMREPSTH